MGKDSTSERAGESGEKFRLVWRKKVEVLTAAGEAGARMTYGTKTRVDQSW